MTLEKPSNHGQRNSAPALLLSIIIPTRDSETTLGECLRSIRENGYSNYELIIIDGGSRDRTEEIARAYTDKIIRQSPAGGREEARNLGYLQARGEIIVCTDSDNVLEKGALEKMSRYFLSHPEVDAVTGMNTRETPAANFASQYKNLYLYKNFSRLPPEVDFLYGSLYGVRRADYPLATMWVDDTARGQELARNNKRIRFRPELKTVHLKRYNLASLLVNDFLIPYGWARIFMKYQGWRRLLGAPRRGYSHVPPDQLASLILSPFLGVTAAAAFIIPVIFPLAFLLGCLWLYLNRYFLRILAGEKGFVFMLAGLAFTWVDHCVMLAGVTAGVGV
ncbi:MAG: glycosyltransferase family 2 protein, partial [Proteobacteria bacterium]|nr:glycosyltransferase family 2 protein [Pseudomonadota bacterium]